MFYQEQNKKNQKSLYKHTKPFNLNAFSRQKGVRMDSPHPMYRMDIMLTDMSRGQWAVQVW